jgi:hypothetical protein
MMGEKVMRLPDDAVLIRQGAEAACHDTTR